MKNYYNLKMSYSRALLNKKVEIERAKDINKEIESITADKDETQALYNQVEQYFSTLSQLKLMISKESNEYKQRRKDYLDDGITESLMPIFPESGFRADVILDTFRGQNIAYLRLINKYGMERIPASQEGKMCQYLVSFGAINHVVSALGLHNIYIDEAFGASSMKNLVKMGDLLDKSIKDGNQLIVISQNPLLYDSIPRREIRFHKDEFSNAVVIDSIEDK